MHTCVRKQDSDPVWVHIWATGSTQKLKFNLVKKYTFDGQKYGDAIIISQTKPAVCTHATCVHLREAPGESGYEVVVECPDLDNPLTSISVNMIDT